MPSPYLTAPLVAAVAGYLNAKFSVSYDAELLSAIAPTVTDVLWRQYRGRLNLFYQLQALATAPSSAQRCFLRFEGKSWTYVETYDLVLRYATWMQTRHGVRSGDIVALDSPNTAHFVVLLFAIWTLGAKPALVNYNLRAQSLEHCLKSARTKLVIIDVAVAENVTEDLRARLPDLRFEVFSPALEAEIACIKCPPPTGPEDRAEMDDLAVLVYTSGTTGLPKPAIVSWGKLVVVGGFTARWIGTRFGDVFYTSMPLYHATALIMGFSHVLSVGATLALGRKFSTSNFWNEVRSHDATIMQYVGETCRYLLAAPPSVDPRTGESLDKKHKVRIAFGNGLRPDIWNRFKDRFGIKTVAEFYGLTEGSFGTWNLSRNDFTVGAVGRHGALYKIFLGRDAAIVELDFDREEPRRDPRTGFCKRVRTGEPGELMWRLPPKNIESRFQGYYGDEQSTSKKVMRSVFAKDDAWLRTGDVMRADRENRLYFTDRIGDTFRWKCQNVSTAEVAANLGQHPAVLELNVYGVQVPHHDGRAGCAAIKFHLSAEQDGSPKADVLQSLAGHAQAGLPKYAVPQFLRVVRGSGLEATGTNKYPKNMLRDQGIVPDKAHPDEIFWLRENTYVKFDGEAWKKLSAESVRL